MFGFGKGKEKTKTPEEVLAEKLEAEKKREAQMDDAVAEAEEEGRPFSDVKSGSEYDIDTEAKTPAEELDISLQDAKAPSTEGLGEIVNLGPDVEKEEKEEKGEDELVFVASNDEEGEEFEEEEGGVDVRKQVL